MAMTSASIAAELQRKRNLGIKPTNSANMGAYNSLTAKPAVGHAQPNPAATTQKQPISIGDTNAYVRKTLTDNGFADGDIGWDPGRKMVTVGGKDFLSPTQNVGGYSVASRDAIANALGQYRDNQANTKTNDLYGRLETALNTPYKAPEFNYDPNSDPVYQAAIRRAQANAGTASGNAEAEMNRRGILNSTITGDRVAQIQQSEMGRVSDTVLPQLFQQAYGRYRDSVGDQYQQRRDNIGDTQNLLGVNTGLQDRSRNYDQQQWENRFNFGQAKGTFADGQKTAAQKGQDLAELWKVADATGVIPDQLATAYGIPKGTKTITAKQLGLDERRINADIANMQADNSRQAASANSKSSKSSTPKTPKYSYKEDSDFKSDYSAAAADPAGFAVFMSKNTQSVIDKYGIDGYNALKALIPKK